MGCFANLQVTDKNGGLVTYAPRIALNNAELRNLWRVARKAEGATAQTLIIDGDTVQMRYVFDRESYKIAKRAIV